MPTPEEDRRLKPKTEFRDGAVVCRLFEATKQDGSTAPFFTLNRDGQKFSFFGGIDDLRRAGELIDKAEAELSREQSHEWYTVGKVVALTRDGQGGIFRAEKSFPSHVKDGKYINGNDTAELFAYGEVGAARSQYAVFPRPSDHEVKKGTEFPIRYGDNKRIDLQIDTLRWKEENKATDFAFARWHDRGSMPTIGDRVNIEAVHDYQNVPRDHRATPLHRPVEFGEPEKPLFLTVRRDPKIPGVAWVEGITDVRANAIQSTNDLQAGLDARRAASNNREFHEQDFDAGLRRFTQEGITPSVAPADVPEPKPVVTPPEPPRTIKVGSLEAQIFETTDGTQPTIRLTRTKEGKELSFECGLHDLLEVSRELGLNRAVGQLKEGLAPEKNPGEKEKGTPEQGNGHAVTTTDREQQSDKALETTHAQETREKSVQTPPPPEEKLEHAPPEDKSEHAPSKKSREARDNKHYVAGIWHGAEPPKKHQPIRFVTGTGDIRQRIMTPREGEVKVPPEGTAPIYVIGKVTADGQAVAQFKSTNFNSVVLKTCQLQRSGDVQERRARQERYRENGRGLTL